MNEKERELRQKMAAKTEEIRGLMNEGKLDDAEQATEELRRLKRELQVEITLGENSVDTVPPEARQHQNHDNDIDVNQSWLVLCVAINCLKKKMKYWCVLAH